MSGGGWFKEAHLAYGFPFSTQRIPMDILNEQVEIVRRSWGIQRFAFQGTHYRLADPAPGTWAATATTIVAGSRHTDTEGIEAGAPAHRIQPSATRRRQATSGHESRPHWPRRLCALSRRVTAARVSSEIFSAADGAPPHRRHRRNGRALADHERGVEGGDLGGERSYARFRLEPGRLRGGFVRDDSGEPQLPTSFCNLYEAWPDTDS
jgi:hypothetical protein